ncbi:unnamed protein product, partial [marine sediment metagenome]
LLIVLTTSCQPTSNSTNQESADLVITNAKIFTSNKQQPWAEALAIKDGKFIYVGDANGIASYKSTNSINLNGKLVIPGLTDAHTHPGYGGVEKFGEVEGDTKENLLAAVKEYAEEHPDDKWLRLCCWPTDMFVHGNKGPDKEVLDLVFVLAVLYSHFIQFPPFDIPYNLYHRKTLWSNTEKSGKEMSLQKI